MKAAGYARVSSLEQVEGTSLQAQENQIRAYATMKGLELVNILVDAGVSGGKPIAERLGGATLVSLITQGVIQCVIVLKLDRAFRNTVDCLQTVGDWERRGVALHIIDLGGNSIDSQSPAGRFMLTVLSAAAEMERGLIRDRCNSGRKARQAEGKRIGEVPYGYTLASDGKSLVEEPTEQEGLRLIHFMRTQGHTLRYIATELNQRGFRSKKGGAWTHGQVARVIRSHNLIQRKVA